MVNKGKLYRFTEFSFIWIGFCFTIVSIASYQWVVGGPCFRAGLFMQCGDSDGTCTCNQLAENFSWLQASAACGVLSTIISGIAVILFLVSDIKFRRKLTLKIRWKYFMLLLLAVADVFVITSAALFTANNEQLMTSMARVHPNSCGFQLQYGYGFALAWISFVLLLCGCAMTFFNVHKSKI